MALLQLKDGTIIEVEKENYREITLEEVQDRLNHAKAHEAELEALLPTSDEQADASLAAPSEAGTEAAPVAPEAPATPEAPTAPVDGIADTAAPAAPADDNVAVDSQVTPADPNNVVTLN